MKKIFFLTILTALMAPAILNAQSISSADSAVFNQLLKANKKYRSIKTPFRHDLIKKNSTQECYGTLYYEQVSPKKDGDVEGRIAMLYDVPKDDYYIITGTNLYNGIDGHRLNFGYRFFPVMKLLGNAVALAMNGDIFSIQSKLNTSYTLSADKTHYIVSLRVKKGYNKGITRMLMKYSKASGMIEYLEIEEKLGITHKYTMGLDSKGKYHKPQVNVTIDQSVYKI